MPKGRYWLETLGCPKNQVDSDKLAGVLEADGFARSLAPEQADLVVVNTCAFIEAARQESIGAVLELAALRYGIAAPAHFAEGAGAARARYATERHLDLFDYLANFGASGALRGGMDLLLKMIGLPGKMAVDGSQVQELYEQGRLEEIHRYCRNDVIQTYFLFLRVELIRGRIDDAAYRLARAASAHFLAEIGAPPGPG